MTDEGEHFKTKSQTMDTRLINTSCVRHFALFFICNVEIEIFTYNKFLSMRVMIMFNDSKMQLL